MSKTKYLGYKAEPRHGHLNVQVLTTSGNMTLRMPPWTPHEKIIKRIKNFLPHLNYSDLEPKMQLEIGKRYKRRDGKVTGPLIQRKMGPDDNGCYTFLCPNTDDSYHITGEFHIGKESPEDLIKEYVELPSPREDGAKSDKVGTGLILIPWYSILELGKIFIEGLRYGRDNWKKGVDDKAYQEERLEHAILHLLKWKEGDRSEQHLAKVMWFCTTQLELERMENEKTTNSC